MLWVRTELEAEQPAIGSPDMAAATIRLSEGMLQVDEQLYMV